MKFKGTSWFFLFVLGLAAVTYYLEIVVPEKKEAEEKVATQVVSLAKDQINFIKVNREGNSIELQRSADGWNFLTPIKDIADNEAVESFLTDIVDQRASETAKEGVGIDWKTFQLDKPKAVIELKNSAGMSVQIAISHSTNFEGKFYLRRNAEEKVLIGENRWQSIGDKTVFDLRDKRLLRGRSVSVDEIQWTVNKDKIVLQQKDNQWQLQGSQFKLDTERVKSFLNLVQDSRVAEYVSEQGLTQKIKDEKKLGSPLGHLQLKLKDKMWKADFYKGDADSYFASLAEPPFVLKLNLLEIEKLAKVDRMYFRDHKEPFQFPNEADVKSIEFQSPLKKWQLNWVGNEWKLASPEAGKSKDSPKADSSEVDPDKVKGMLTKLRNLEVDEFLGMKKLAKSLENRLILRDGQGKVIQNFQWGASYKKKVDKEEKSFFTIQTALLQEPVAVESTHFDEITVQDIFKSKTPPTPPPAEKEEHTE